MRNCASRWGPSSTRSSSRTSSAGSSRTGSARTSPCTPASTSTAIRCRARWLTTLPGVGAATAEQMVASLRRKVTKFALLPAATAADGHAPPTAVVDGNLLEDAYQALLGIGHNPIEARNRLDKALAGGRT